MNFFSFTPIVDRSYVTYDSNPYFFIVLLLVFILIFYITVLYPQQKRVKEHKKLINSISKGDEIITTGGIVGQIVKITDSGYIIMEINDNKIIIRRDFIAAVLPKGTIKSL